MNKDAETETIKPVSLRKIRVLVLDDDEAICRAIQLYLVRQGALAEAVSNGVAGLRMLLQRDYDVLIVDLVMPELDGLSFVRHVREMWPWTSIIGISGFSEQEKPDHFAQFRRLGAIEILSKPLDFGRLAQSVAEGARKKKEHITTRGPFSIEQVQESIVTLRRFCEQALSTDNLHQSFGILSQGLALLTTSSVAGFLHIGQERLLVLNSILPVSPSFLRTLENQMLDRYAILSGNVLLQEDVQIVHQGEPAEAAGPAEISYCYSIPVVIEGRLQGLATLASAYAHSVPPEEIAFLYHAGAQLTTVLVGLDRMRLFSTRDALTGMLNRRGLQHQLQWFWESCKRGQAPLTVMIMDLDHFKTLNDTHGHVIGDRLLQEFAELVRMEVRASDIAARYGGDEIVVVLPDLDDQGAEGLSKRVLSKIREHVFCSDTHRLRLTVSIGFATTTPSPRFSAEGIEVLLARADHALYAAKRAGRDCYRKWEAHISMENSAPTESQRAARSTAQTSGGTVLLVDDEETARTWTTRVLTKAGYTVKSAGTVSEASRLLYSTTTSIDVLLVDLALSDGDGMQILGLAKKRPNPPVSVITSGYLNKERGVQALRENAFDVLEKPFTTAQLLKTVQCALEQRRTQLANAIYQTHLEEMVRERSLALSKAVEEMRRSYEFTLEALASMLDAREHNTAKHSVRVAKLAVILAQEMGLSAKKIAVIRQGALLHDIGKIGVPDHILLKEQPLTDDEWEIMRRHPEIGYNIIKSGDFLREAAEIVYCHQERYDGTGYPRGLKGEEIPLGARIFSVADAYDALRSPRPYKGPFSSTEALARVLEQRGKQFDPIVVDALIKRQTEIEIAGQWDKEESAGLRKTYYY